MAVRTVKRFSADHEAGNAGCMFGFCGVDWPDECPCGGLLHAERPDVDGAVPLRCDRCGAELTVPYPGIPVADFG